jgi:hypothetical protein
VDAARWVISIAPPDRTTGTYVVGTASCTYWLGGERVAYPLLLVEILLDTDKIRIPAHSTSAMYAVSRQLLPDDRGSYWSLAKSEIQLHTEITTQPEWK